MDELNQLQTMFQKETAKNQAFKSNKRYFIKSLMGLFALYLFLNYIVGISIVSGPSMEPNLYNNDLILYNKLSFSYERGDVVIVESNDHLIVKRVIGVPGDVVDIDSNNWKVIINGVSIDEPYIYNNQTKYIDVSFPKTVPKDCYFVLGDNREVSLDSRDSRIGMVFKKNIQGKEFALFRP